MLKRLFIRPGLYLTVGTVITVATAWSIAAWMPLRSHQQLHLSRFLSQPSKSYGPLGIYVHRGVGWHRREWRFSPAHATPSYVSFRCVENDDRKSAIQLDDPTGVSWIGWGRAEQVWRDSEARSWQGCDQACGWPLPALWNEYDLAASPPKVRGGIALHHSAVIGASAESTRALPLRPIWIGLAANVALWSCFAFLITKTARTTRKAIRLRRNHCPLCNYDLSATPTSCPECGWSRPAPRPVDSTSK